MAHYHLHLKTFGRSQGSSAPAAAAYRAGERLRDERSGRIYDHSSRQDVLHKEILIPRDYARADLGWARERASLWNAAEAAESRKNARVAREYLVALPVELDGGSRVDLARGFAQELADRYRFAVDVTVHAPRDFPGSDPRNFHAHLLATTREVERDGLGAKTALELNDSSRRALGLGPSIDELLHVRARWAAMTNEALREANVEARVDHRSLRAQGIDRDPLPWIPRVAYEVERRGFYSPVAERIRAEQAERAGRERHGERSHDATHAARNGPATHAARDGSAAHEARDGSAAVPTPAAARPSLEELQRQSAQNWLRHREQLTERAMGAPAKSRGAGAGAGADDDFGL